AMANQRSLPRIGGASSTLLRHRPGSSISRSRSRRSALRTRRAHYVERRRYRRSGAAACPGRRRRSRGYARCSARRGHARAARSSPLPPARRKNRPEFRPGRKGLRGNEAVARSFGRADSIAVPMRDVENGRMKHALVALLFFAVPLFAADGKLSVALEPLGDSAEGVVARVSYRFTVPTDAPSGVPLVITGSISQNGQVVKRFRYPVLPSTTSPITSIQTLQPGAAEIDVRLMVPLEEQTPVILAKATQTFTVAKTGTAYVAHEGEGAEAILAEGVVPEGIGAVKIVPPRRDVAPNLFVVEVEVTPPVTRVEFWVEGKKILARNAPPYRAELDLGALPKRVEVRAIGYDAQGRY